MEDDNLKYGFEHWMDLHQLGKGINGNMIEVPEGDVVIRGKTFRVGKFKISKSLVTEASWAKVIDVKQPSSRKPVTNISFKEISNYLQRLMVPWKGAGYLSIPTEAQLERAKQCGVIKFLYRNFKDICLTHFRMDEEIGTHHYFDNLPTEEPFNLVVKGYDSRSSIQYDQPAEDVGFRLVLVGYYMSRRQISQAIVDALEISEYKSVYKRVGGSCRMYFDYDGDSATICPSNPGRPCIMMFPDQVKEDTIVVSTDVLRVPQEMDPDDIVDRLIELNSESESEGIRYEAPFLYHANPDINRAVLVIKEFRAISTAAIMLMLPSAVEGVLNATASFNKRFHHKV